MAFWFCHQIQRFEALEDQLWMVNPHYSLHNHSLHMDQQQICIKDEQDMIPVNNQLDAQFFMYVYVYFLHVSGSHMLIFRRIIVSMRHLVYVTLCRWPSGMLVSQLCIKLVIYKDHTKMHCQQNIKWTRNLYNITKIHKFHIWLTQNKKPYITIKLTLGDHI